MKSNASSSFIGSTSPRIDEAPPAFAPLGADEEVPAESNEIEMAPAEQAGVEVHVVFPADLDDGRMRTPDSDDSRKAPSGNSLLGTKSGSTSLLSMLSGSPRSLGTAHDTASGPPSPRTPLPKASAGGIEGAEKGKDGNVLPSAHHTPLSIFGGDTDLPIDHPTPLSTTGSSRGKGGSRRRSKPPVASAAGTGSGSVAPKGATSVPGKTTYGNDESTNGDTNKVVNPAPSTFMQRLKYWNAGATEENKARSPAGVPPAVAPPTMAPPAEPALTTTADKPPYRDDVDDLGMKLATGTINVSNKGAPREPEQSVPSSLAENSPYCSEVGVKVVPLDTDTSDAVSVFDSEEFQREWRAKPPPPSKHSWLVQASEAEAAADGVVASQQLARDTTVAPGDGNREMGTNAAQDLGGGAGEVEAEVNLEVDDEVESDMDWDAVSEGENQDEKREILPPPLLSPPPPPLTEEETKPAPSYSHERAKRPSLGTEAPQRSPRTRDWRDYLVPEQHDQQPPPPRYMAIVESANVTSALDLSSTSEHDTSPSEDDGGMLEILTDRLMEACVKIEQVSATPVDELSDGGTSVRRWGGARDPLSAMRRRQLSTVSSRAFSRDQVRYLCFTFLSRC